MRERERNSYKEGEMAMKKHLSIQNLNVNGLNAPIKGHRVASCIGKHDLHICFLEKNHFRTKDLYRLKEKG